MKDALKQKIKERKKIEIIRTACRLFSKKGYYNTTIPDIANELNMSVGNIYNYFRSKEELAKTIMLTVSSWIAEKFREINEADMPTKQKIEQLTKAFFRISKEEPELIEYFLRVFLANREVFLEDCRGFACVGEVVTEIMVLLLNGVERGELRNMDFFVAFTTLMGSMGGLVFLSGEGTLDKDLMDYAEELADTLWKALKI